MKAKRTVLRLQSLVLVTVLLCIATLNSSAKPNLAPAALTFTAPDASGAILAELDEFATTVLGDPWDMNEATDLWAYRSDSQMSASTFSGGIYSAQMTAGNGTERITLLTAGASNNTAMRIGKIGYRFPIDANHYHYLTYRFYKSNSECNRALVSWYEEDTRTSAVQGVSNDYWACETSKAGWHTKVIDLATIGIQTGSKNWSGTIRELILKPFSGSGAANATVKLDWARLTSEDPETARPYTIQWTGGSGTIDLYASPGDTTLDADDFLIAENVDGSSGSYIFQTGILPADDYYIAADTGSGAVWSNGPLTINAPPQITFTSPSMTSGQDYAETEKGNAWDMSDSADINDKLQPWEEPCVNSEQFSSGVYSAQLYDCPGGSTYTDPILYLGGMNPYPPGPQDPTIDTSKYRYLSFRYTLSGEQNIGQGWVARIGWWQVNGTDGIVTEDVVMGRDMIILEGWNTYKVDLWAADVVDESHAVQRSWVDSAPNRLRFDPAELAASLTPATIQIDWIKLTAMDEVTQGDGFPIQFETVTSGETTVTFYYDTDTDSTNGRTSIDTITISSWGQSGNLTAGNTLSASNAPQNNLSAAEGSYTLFLPLVLNNYCSGNCLAWNTAGVSPGEYYICAELDDTINTTYRCSESPLLVN